MKQKIALLAGYGQLVIVYLNQALAANGGVIPQNRDQWMKLISSAAVAYGVHQASLTSANHPNGADTKPAEMLPYTGGAK